MDPHSFPAGLYVAATPIGHLADISERVRQALTHCDRIYAEDTRHTQALLSALGISRKNTACTLCTTTMNVPCATMW